jgi:hypothetical protein
MSDPKLLAAQSILKTHFLNIGELRQRIVDNFKLKPLSISGDVESTILGCLDSQKQLIKEQYQNVVKKQTGQSRRRKIKKLSKTMRRSL